jgi:CreA protein
MQVIRMCDPGKNTLAYLVYTDEIIGGFPKNSLSVVPIQPWAGQSAKDVPSCKDHVK